MFFYDPKIFYPSQDDNPYFILPRPINTSADVMAKAYAALHSLLDFSYKECRRMLKWHEMDDDRAMVMYPVGRLGFNLRGKAQESCEYSRFRMH